MSAELNLQNDTMALWKSSWPSDGLPDNGSLQEGTVKDFAEYKVAVWLNKSTPWIALIVAVLGNGAAIITVMKMRTLTSLALFVSYLGVADTLCIISNFSYTQLSRAKTPLGDGGCKGLLFFMNFVKALANWTVVIMTLERFVAVFFPFKITQIFSLKKAILALAIKGAILFLITTVALRIYHEDTSSRQCAEDPVYADVAKIAGWVDLALISLCPCILLMFLNGGIIIKLSKSAKVRQQVSNSHLLRKGPGDPAVRQGAITHTNISVMLVTVSVAFIILQLPITIFYIITRSKPYPTELHAQAVRILVGEIVHTLNEFNHAFNFFFYFLSGRKFRQKFLKVFGCRRLLAWTWVLQGSAGDSVMSKGQSGVDTKMSKLNSLDISIDSQGSASLKACSK